MSSPTLNSQQALMVDDATRPTLECPTFLIAGAQKCGTTTLHYLLHQHPDCYLPQDKEPQAFASIAYDWARYRTLFTREHAGKPYRVAGEASTSYLVVPGVPERIRHECGSMMRFIFILRNPLDRTLSSYLHMYKRGHEFRDWNELFASVEAPEDAAVEAESKCCVSAESDGKIISAPYRPQYGEFGLWPFQYINGSLYSRHIERYIRYFGREQIHILFLEDLHRDPARELRKVFTFLEIDADFVPQNPRAVRNKTVVNQPLHPLSHEVRVCLNHFFRGERRRVSNMAGGIPSEWE